MEKDQGLFLSVKDKKKFIAGLKTCLECLKDIQEHLSEIKTDLGVVKTNIKHS
jgi:hypothetical protein